MLNGCAPTPTPSAPESVYGQSHEIYAGFTNNESMPFIMFHQSGESLIMTQDVNSSNVTGSVWNSADGKSAVIYSDNNGRPTSVVVGEDVIFYSNYTNDTVDLTVIQADGTRTVFQSKLDTNLLNKITTLAPSSDSMVSYSMSNSLRRKQQDKWFWMKNGMYMLGVVGCTAGILTMTSGTALPVLYALAGVCTGAILGTVNKVGTFLKIDVGGLESVNETKTLVDCGKAIGLQELQELTSCVELYIPIAEEQERVSKLILSNPNYSGLQQGTIPFEPAATEAPEPAATEAPIPTSVTHSQIGENYICGWIQNDSQTGALAPTLIIMGTNEVVELGILESSKLWQIMDFGIPGYFQIYDPIISNGSLMSFSQTQKVYSCESSSPLPSNSSQSTQAQISNEVYFAALRQSPGYSNKDNTTDLLANVPAGDIVQILGGPKQADGLNWWNVSWNGISGWMADHTGSGKTIMIFLQ
jgi:hypothetical protein